MKEDQLAVRGQADIRLEAVDPGRQRPGQGRGGGVGPIGATEAVCVKRWNLHTNMALNAGPAGVTGV